MDKTKQESDYFYIWKALACTLVVFYSLPISWCCQMDFNGGSADRCTVFLFGVRLVSVPNR